MSQQYKTVRLGANHQARRRLLWAMFVCSGLLMAGGVAALALELSAAITLPYAAYIFAIAALNIGVLAILATSIMLWRSRPSQQVVMLGKPFLDFQLLSPIDHDSLDRSVAHTHPCKPLVGILSLVGQYVRSYPDALNVLYRTRAAVLAYVQTAGRDAHIDQLVDVAVDELLVATHPDRAKKTHKANFTHIFHAVGGMTVALTSHKRVRDYLVSPDPVVQALAQSLQHLAMQPHLTISTEGHWHLSMQLLGNGVNPPDADLLTRVAARDQDAILQLQQRLILVRLEQVQVMRLVHGTEGGADGAKQYEAFPHYQLTQHQYNLSVLNDAITTSGRLMTQALARAVPKTSDGLARHLASEIKEDVQHVPQLTPSASQRLRPELTQ